MRIRKQATYDGVWTVFIGDGLCISALNETDADALMDAFSRIAGTAD
ncbi:hypothetical protein [uncultured Methylobacterium sp.]